MVSEKVKRILISRGAPYTEAQMESMTEAEAWSWVYSHPRPRTPKRHEICFTGFRPDEKAELTRLAEQSGFGVAKTVTKNLVYLCAGPNAGPAKLVKAQAQATQVVSVDAFRALCQQDADD